MPIWPTSARWDPAIRTGAPLVQVVEVWRDNVRQTLPGGATSLLVNSLTLRIDEASKVRRQATFSLGNLDLAPTSLSSLLSPVGTDLKAWVGITYTEGDTELVPVGVFRIREPGQASRITNVAVQIAASDYSQVMIDARFPSPWATPADVLVVDEIRRMVQDVVPWLTVIDLTGSADRTTATSWDRDRWDAVLTLGKSIGAEVFFDQVGRLIIRPFVQVTSTSTPVWTINAGTPDAVITDVSTLLSLQGVYNAVSAASSAPGVNVSGAAYQESGPLAWPAFQKPVFFRSPYLGTVDQCYHAASAILARSVAFARQVTPTLSPNWALDAGDITTVLLPASPAEPLPQPELRALTAIAFTIPEELSSPPAMTVNTRVGTDVGFTTDLEGLS